MVSLFGMEFSVRISLKRKSLSPQVDAAVRDVVLKTYSQFHEDLVLRQIFERRNNGFYIDIGTNHPAYRNNTKKFYDIGWRGINIEPNLKLYKVLLEQRLNDTNINCGVGDVAGEMLFYEMIPDCYSTFDAKNAMKAMYSTRRKVVSETRIPIMTINEIFALHEGVVDFLSIDTEGFDYKVLSVNDWKRNRPFAIVVELNQDIKNRIYDLLIDNGYHLVHYNFTNGIFVSEEYVSLLSV